MRKARSGSIRCCDAEFLKIVLHVCNRTTEQKHVAIAKIVLMIVVEVFVGHVAAAGYARYAVEDSRLVVHALVDGPKAGDGVLQSLPESDTD